jgi:enoyl-CoA hydratase
MTDALVVVDDHSPVPLVRLNRPQALGALNSTLLRDLNAAVTDLAGRPSTRAIVITGTGEKAFSAGADLDELTGLSSTAAYELLSGGQAVLRRIELCPVPVIAAVNGLALGGGFELVLATTFPVLAERATLGLPEAGLGLIPGYGGTQRLTRAIGRQSTVHAMLTGARISAARAYQLGLTPIEPVPGPELVDAALTLGHQIAGKGPHAVRAILSATTAALDQSLEAGLGAESALAAVATSGTEAAEGIAAFRGKRAAAFADVDRSTP